MSHVRSQHPNARLTPTHRRNMVDCVLVKGWPVAATAERFQVDPKTVRKWVNRFNDEGETGLVDRSSRPHRSPNRTPRACRRRVIRLRTKRRWGADHIAHETGLAASTVQAILNHAGLGRLDTGDRANTREPVRRYERDRPGELVHVDIKKLPGIPNGGGWRIWGRGQAPPSTAVGFWHRALNWFASHGIRVERVLTDNGACYRSCYWHHYNAAVGITVKKTRPYRPQTNGKIERFHRILIEEWAYIRPWTSETERHDAHAGFIHYYNHHRSHGALKWATPIATLNRDNLPAEHS